MRAAAPANGPERSMGHWAKPSELATGVVARVMHRCWWLVYLKPVSGSVGQLHGPLQMGTRGVAWGGTLWRSSPER